MKNRPYGQSSAKLSVCHPVCFSSSHPVMRSSGHLVIWSSSHQDVQVCFADNKCFLSLTVAWFSIPLLRPRCMYEGLLSEVSKVWLVDGQSVLFLTWVIWHLVRLCVDLPWLPLIPNTAFRAHTHQYLHGIHTVSTQYLHSINTISISTLHTVWWLVPPYCPDPWPGPRHGHLLRQERGHPHRHPSQEEAALQGLPGESKHI